jgi:hypothetical protein
MDVRLLPVDGNYGLNGVQAGTVIFQFLPEERDLVLLILQGMYESATCVEARAELRNLMTMLDPVVRREGAVIN